MDDDMYAQMGNIGPCLSSEQIWSYILEFITMCLRSPCGRLNTKASCWEQKGYSLISIFPSTFVCAGSDCC